LRKIQLPITVTNQRPTRIHSSPTSNLPL